jgi:hypothetical protein
MGVGVSNQHLHILLKRKSEMKPNKSILLVLLMGLLFAIFAVAMAQSTSQNTQAKKSDTSCCKSDSCPMKDVGAAKDAKDGCCCCSGDSCDMKAHDNMKNHAEDNAGCCCCSGDSCDMKTHENMKNHASGQECCCDEKHKDSKAKQKAA